MPVLTEPGVYLSRSAARQSNASSVPRSANTRPAAARKYGANNTRVTTPRRGHFAEAHTDLRDDLGELGHRAPCNQPKRFAGLNISSGNSADADCASETTKVKLNTGPPVATAIQKPSWYADMGSIMRLGRRCG